MSVDVDGFISEHLQQATESNQAAKVPTALQLSAFGRRSKVKVAPDRQQDINSEGGEGVKAVRGEGEIVSRPIAGFTSLISGCRPPTRCRLIGSGD